MLRGRDWYRPYNDHVSHDHHIIIIELERRLLLQASWGRHARGQWEESYTTLKRQDTTRQWANASHVAASLVSPPSRARGLAPISSTRELSAACAGPHG
jgi:hypothetical protein